MELEQNQMNYNLEKIIAKFQKNCIENIWNA